MSVVVLSLSHVFDLGHLDVAAWAGTLTHVLDVGD